MRLFIKQCLAVLVGMSALACFGPPRVSGDNTYANVLPFLDNDNSYVATNPNKPNNPNLTMTAAVSRDPNYSPGPNSKYNAVADLDGDGLADVAVSNNVLNDVRIYHDPGSSNAPPAVIALGDGPRHIVALDLNHDGAVDLAAATDQNIAIMLNDGGGNFNTIVTYSLGSTGGFRITAADLNNDTYPDLVVGGMNDTLALFKNAGNGTFTNFPSVAMTTTNGRTDVNAADVTGDELPDIVAVTLTPTALNVFVNQGDGTFAPPVSYAYSTSGHIVALFDLNGDGYLDVVVSDYNETLTLAINDGKGGFTNHQTLLLDSDLYPDDISFGDLTGDGLADMVISTWSGMDVTVLVNEGHGNFGHIQHFPIDDNNWQVHAVDMNGDGKLDLISSSQTYTLTLMFNRGP